MKISVAEAQGQFLELVRLAEAGEEVVLTHEGRMVAKLGAVASPARRWAELTPEARLSIIREVVANTRLLISAGTLAEAYVAAARSGFTTALESFLRA
jgi:antitoxin (DNA-binding transcriptional repressor) of toxin-antitoxin stability system